jgi:predicted nucleic acid-binding protein
LLESKKIVIDTVTISNDGKARKTIRDTYGYSDFTGTVAILEELIQNGFITNHDARLLLEEMIEKGFWYRGSIPF